MFLDGKHMKKKHKQLSILFRLDIDLEGKRLLEYLSKIDEMEIEIKKKKKM